MVLIDWNDLPREMQTEEVRKYYNILQGKTATLTVKRGFDIIASLLLLSVFFPAFLCLSLAIRLDSEGPVFYRQERVTQYGKIFRIHKFRSMVSDADKKGSLVTVRNDARVTKVGAFIRKYRLDEIPQLIDILEGNMSFVGTRPEVPKYVEKYTPEMLATLLLPAGVTSEASIQYKDENKLLDAADDVDKVYIEQVLPGKMAYNLMSLENLSLGSDFLTMLRTVLAVLGMDFGGESDK